MSPPDTSLDETATRHEWFKTTHWTVVLDARRDDSTQAQAALAKLCQVYWPPLYAYVRRSGHAPEDAKDLTQEFFARLLEKDYLKAVHQEKGKFRSFLLLVLKRFLANQRDHANCQKRGGGQEIISLDEQDTEQRYLSEPADGMTPEKDFERRWAMALLEQVLIRLQEEFNAAGKSDLFRELEVFISGEKTQHSYAEIAARLGMSEGAVRVSVHRLRRRYRELLRLEVANTVDTPEAVDAEIRQLFTALS